MKNNLFIFALLIMVIIAFAGMANADIYEFETEYDFGGETVTIATFEGFLQEKYNEGEYEEWKLTVEDKFNVNIEFNPVSWGNIQEEVTASLVAGDPVGDVLYHYYREFPYFVSQGVFMPLDDVLDDEYWNSLPPTQKNAKDVYKLKDTFYAFSTNGPGYYWNQDREVAYWSFNKDIIEKEGLANPYDLYEKGDWTWDNFYDIVEQATQDTNSDGEIDQWGLSTFLTPGHLPSFNGFLVQNGGSFMKYEDDKVKSTLTDKVSIQTLEFVSKLYQNDIWHPGGPTAFEEGNAAFGPQPSKIDVEEINFDYGIIPPPKGPNADSHIVGSSQQQAAILVTTPHDPEALVELTNALLRTTDKYRDMDKYMDQMLEEILMDMPDERSAEIVAELYEKPFVLSYWNDAERLGMGEYYQEVLEGETSPVAAMEEFEPEYQAFLDELFEQ